MAEEETSPPEPPAQQPAAEQPLPPKKAETPENDDAEEKKTQAENLITKAEAAALRQEEANKELSRLLDRQEAMRVETTLGGKTEAGQPIKVEMAPEEYAKKVMANEIETKAE